MNRLLTREQILEFQIFVDSLLEKVKTPSQLDEVRTSLLEYLELEIDNKNEELEENSYEM